MLKYDGPKLVTDKEKINAPPPVVTCVKDDLFIIGQGSEFVCLTRGEAARILETITEFASTATDV